MNQDALSDWPGAAAGHSVPRGSWKAWAFGVVLPAGVLMFETVSGFCASVFFNPVPTFWHFLLLALVPVMNGVLLKSGTGERPQWRGWLAGVAAVVAVFYALLFLPMAHLSIFALIFVGLGMLSLTPIFAGIATVVLARRAMAQSEESPQFARAWKQGLVAGLLALVALEAGGVWTRVQLATAVEGGEAGEAAIDRLRWHHSPQVMLRTCYEFGNGPMMNTDIGGWLVNGWRLPAAMIGDAGWNTGPGVEARRDVYFRVTGEAFNTRPPPSRGIAMPGRRIDPLAEFEFDAHLGGDEVAVRLKNLDLVESRFDGHACPASRIAYGEWTMVFENRSMRAQEARCQVRLPRDGRVSRLTLWVNGEPEEAAFHTVSAVKAAYRAVAVVQRLDPVLVTEVGPDTVMMQCFPVPAQGRMKIRLGVTAPLHNGKWELPYLLERNFGIPNALEHAVWMQSPEPLRMTEGRVATRNATGSEGGYLLSEVHPHDRTLAGGLIIDVAAAREPAGVVWCEDRFAPAHERILVREPAEAVDRLARRLIVVVDGSASMKERAKMIAAALQPLDPAAYEILLADDGAREIPLDALEKHRFSGGRDNAPALREALLRASEKGADIVWIHGPQAVRLSQSESVIQRIERGAGGISIHRIEARPGPNRLAEMIYKTGALKRGPSLEDDGEAVAQYLREITGFSSLPAWRWKRAPAAEGIEGTQVWDQLARLWAATTVDDPMALPDDAARSQRAAGYQLVTAHSGAVVLETQRQYEEHGLDQVDPASTPSIPNIPEPSTWMLVMLAGLMTALRRRR